MDRIISKLICYLEIYAHLQNFIEKVYAKVQISYKRQNIISSLKRFLQKKTKDRKGSIFFVLNLPAHSSFL
jgi:hypothetical protein